jgi:hypothetical protein
MDQKHDDSLSPTQFTAGTAILGSDADTLLENIREICQSRRGANLIGKCWWQVFDFSCDLE